MSRFVAIASGRILNAVSALIAVRLYTELLTTVQVGRLSLLLSSVALLNLFLVAPVSSYVIQKAIQWHAEGTLIEQLKRPLLYSFVSSAFAIVVTTGLIRAGLLATSVFVAPLVGFAVLGTGLSGFGSQLFNYLGRPFKYVALSVASSWAGVAIAGFLCLRVAATAEAWMLGNISAQVAIGLLSIVLIRKSLGSVPCNTKPKSGATGFDLWAIALYSTPMLISTCLSWVQTDGYRYLFAHLVDERTLGLFAAGLAVGLSPMMLLDRLLSDTYLPILARAIALNGREHWPRSWDAYASSCILPLVLFTMLAGSGTTLLAKLLVSHTYYAVAWIGVFGCVAKCLQMIAAMYVAFSYAALETAHLIGPYLIGAVVTVGCILLLTPISPFTRFGLSLVCGAGAVVVAMARAARKRYNLRFPYLALGRAVALGLPIVGVNCAAEFLFPVRTAFGAIALLAGDTAYIAGLWWVLNPKGGGAGPNPTQMPVLVSEQGAEA